MSLNTFWRERVKRNYRIISSQTRNYGVHWRIAVWRDFSGGKREEKPAKPACMLSDQPIVSVETFLVPQKKNRKQGFAMINAFRDCITCEACLIMFDGMTEVGFPKI